MVHVEESPRPRAGGAPPAVRPVKVDCGGHHCYLFHHLSLAAEEITQRGDLAGGVERFAAVAARFRDLGYGPRREGVGPVVVLEDGALVPLSDLLAASWPQHRGAFPSQGIDAELLAAARQLLLELDWHLPDL